MDCPELIPPKIGSPLRLGLNSHEASGSSCAERTHPNRQFTILKPRAAEAAGVLHSRRGSDHLSGMHEMRPTHQRGWAADGLPQGWGGALRPV